MKKPKTIEELFILWDIQEEINRKALRISDKKAMKIIESIFIKD